MTEKHGALRITVAPNGARRKTLDHPMLPVTQEAIVDCAAACYRAGADEIHLHVRDEDQRHSLSTDRYRRTIHALEDRVPNMAIQITTESAGLYDVEAQFALLTSLRPKAASVAVRETMRRPDLVKPLYHAAAEAHIKVQHILYSVADLVQLRQHIEAGDVPAHMRDVLLVFGRYDPPQLAKPSDVAPFVESFADDFPNWTVCGFGQHENAVAAQAIQLGGHIRIGFENNIQRPDGTAAADNAENIALAVQTAKAFDRPLKQRSL